MIQTSSPERAGGAFTARRFGSVAKSSPHLASAASVRARTSSVTFAGTVCPAHGFFPLAAPATAH